VIAFSVRHFHHCLAFCSRHKAGLSRHLKRPLSKQKREIATE
jgi:hypothetical protein